ncbi:MAG: hypothetical protein Q8O52_20920 [Sulfuritalea sp.]|nr:hypothetical protein [Sulfuritalea sp.]
MTVESDRTSFHAVIEIDRRQALPIRAIPYVAGERHSADRVAEFLAQWNEVDGKPRYSGLTAYLWKDGQAKAITPQEFDRIAWAVKGLEQELMESHPRLDSGAPNPIGAVAFDEKSAEKLPAGVFVWLDEFAAAFQDDSNRIDRYEARQLNLSPALMDEQTKNMILEGFVDSETEVGAGKVVQETTAVRQARLQQTCNNKEGRGCSRMAKGNRQRRKNIGVDAEKDTYVEAGRQKG